MQATIEKTPLPRCFLPVTETPFSQAGTTKDSCLGYCAHCHKEHTLPVGAAHQHCQELIQLLENEERVDLSVAPQEATEQFSTGYLFGKARGQMFGVLFCKTAAGIHGTLRAFSGQYNSSWLVDGWVPPLLDVDEFYRVTSETEKEIKRLGRELEPLAPGSERRNSLLLHRKTLSQKLMKEIHALYRLTNFRGETRPLTDVFLGPGGIPTGAGDCCAPKLLNYAALHNLVPLGLAEFYWGQENASGTRQHGTFYAACQEKCQPILGYLLCGLGHS